MGNKKEAASDLMVKVAKLHEDGFLTREELETAMEALEELYRQRRIEEVNADQHLTDVGKNFFREVFKK